MACANLGARTAGSIHYRISFDFKNRESPARPGKDRIKNGSRKSRHDRNVRANWLHLLSADNENEHAVRLARSLRSGSDDSDGVDRLPCRSAFRRRAQSRAAVRLHRRPRELRISGIASGMISAVIAVGVFRAVLPQSPRDARLRHVGPGAHAAAGGDGCRHRRSSPACCGKDGSTRSRGNRSTTPPRIGCRRRSIKVDIGIVLLDSDTRAEFINRAFRDYFSLSDAQADSKPPFIALMYHGRDTGAWELPGHELSAFIARRTEMMRAGDPRRSTSISPTDRCCVSAARRCPTADAC